MTQSKDGISSINLARSLGISANVALRLKHKLQQIMKTADDAHQLHTIVQIDDAVWGGKKHDGVRGRGETGKTPFVVAVSTKVQGHRIAMRLSCIASLSASGIKRWAHKYINQDSLDLSNALPGFNGIAYAGIFHKAMVTGGGYERMMIPAFVWVNIMLGNVKGSLQGTYYAISSKHRPKYQAEFCYRFNHRFRVGDMVTHLAQFAINSSPIPQHQLKLAEDW